MESLARRLSDAPRSLRPDRPIPVALVITDLDVGGAERALVALATGLDKRRWSPTVICLSQPGKLLDNLQDAKIPTICLGARRARPLRTLKALSLAFRSVKPQLAQSFLFHANLATKLSAKISGVPWCVGGLRVAEKRTNAHLRLDRWTQRLSAGSVCVSEGVRRFSVEVGGLEPERLTVIPNGINPAAFDRATAVPREEFGIPDDAPVALFVGRLERQKGIDVLIEAAAIVLKSRPDAHLILVGDGPERAHWEARLADLARSVHLVGRRDDVPRTVRSADLVVLPSRWEGMPNVVLEAMAARRAVVGTDVEGTNELVIPGETGWLVPVENPRALAEAWLDALSDADRLRRFGEAGRARVEKEFTPENVVARYDALWSRLLGYAG